MSAIEHSLLYQEISSLKKVGPKTLQALRRSGLFNFRDLLFYLPLRYEDRTKLTKIRDLVVGHRALFEATVLQVSLKNWGKPTLTVIVQDGSGALMLRFFHYVYAIQKKLMVGGKFRFFGEVSMQKDKLVVVHPEYSLIKDGEKLPLANSLTPVYSKLGEVGAKLIAGLVNQVLVALDKKSNEKHIEASFAQEVTQVDAKLRELSEDFALTFIQALKILHQPTVQELQQGLLFAKRRLALEELLVYQYRLKDIRSMFTDVTNSLVIAKELKDKFLRNLSFTLTDAQLRVISEIEQDLTQGKLSLRLVQGDVGSGKTVVSAIIALSIIQNGMQVAVMAPTELLAEQHYVNFKHWLEPLGIKVGLFLGSIKGKKRRSNLENLTLGLYDVAVGTHALFQKEVEFKNLGMVIVDEQHRFGVAQRMELRKKGGVVHQIIMSATPIPRTLAMTCYADLDISVIDELPKGRKPITTVALSQNKKTEVVQRIKQVCLNRQQVYWVCTLIEDSEVLQCEAAVATHVSLQEMLPELKIGLVHGRMKAEEKEKVMQDFKQQNIDILVATTVVEVGVDVPNATLMVIEDPQRLGLSQLHQLRGRVGRGDKQSFCILMYKSPLSRSGKARLDIMRETNDGFIIAEKDLELRGPGDILGAQQTGVVNFKFVALEHSEKLLVTTRKWLPKLTGAWVEKLIKRWNLNKDFHKV